VNPVNTVAASCAGTRTDVIDNAVADLHIAIGVAVRLDGCPSTRITGRVHRNVVQLAVQNPRVTASDSDTRASGIGYLKANNVLIVASHRPRVIGSLRIQLGPKRSIGYELD